MTLRERIGIDVGTEMQIEEAVKWAAENDVHYIDVCLDGGTIDPEKYTESGVALIKEVCDHNDIQIGLHTLSAVNVAEISAYVSEAVDEYLRAYIDIGEQVGADRIIIHGGYHFTDDARERIQASKERLQRMIAYAEDKELTLLLENHNAEPSDSEMHYVPVTLDECEDFFDDLKSDSLGWAFNPPHARLFPEGIEGYLQNLGVELCGQVRLNDNDGQVEGHLAPGDGTMDFEALFALLQDEGYNGHYMLKFGSLEEMLEGREYLLDRHSE